MLKFISESWKLLGAFSWEATHMWIKTSWTRRYKETRCCNKSADQSRGVETKDQTKKSEEDRQLGKVEGRWNLQRRAEVVSAWQLITTRGCKGACVVPSSHMPSTYVHPFPIHPVFNNSSISSIPPTLFVTPFSLPTQILHVQSCLSHISFLYPLKNKASPARIARSAEQVLHVQGLHAAGSGLHVKNTHTHTASTSYLCENELRAAVLLAFRTIICSDKWKMKRQVNCSLFIKRCAARWVFFLQGDLTSCCVLSLVAAQIWSRWQIQIFISSDVCLVLEMVR